MTPLRVTGITVLLLLNLGAPAATWAIEPILHARSYNAFTRIYGRPEFFAGSMRERGSSEARITIDLVSFSESERSGGEQIELDGESYQAAVSYNYSATDRWELGAWIPYLYNSGGFMDATVDGFHDLLGFPEGDRPRQGQDELRFILIGANQNQFLLDSAGGDVGDIQLSSRYLITSPDSKARQLALFTGIKLPTGDQANLTGSGATDYSLGLGYSDPSLLRALRTTLSAHAGILRTGKGDVLDDLQKQTVGFGGLQLAFAATRKLTLLAQMQVASAYYDSKLDILGGNTVQLGFAADISWPEQGWHWRFGIVEDGLSKVTPDFTLHMEVSRTFGPR